MSEPRPDDYKVLLVNSDPEELAALTTLLTEQGYGLETARRGRGALEAATGSLPDLLLLSLPLPDMEGIDVWERLKARKQGRTLPVLCVIPQQDPHVGAEILAKSGADYVTRPWQGEEVLQRVRNRLAARAVREQTEEEIERLARFPSENPSPVLRVDQDGSLLYANAASSPLLDYWDCQVGQPLPDEWRRFASDVLSAQVTKSAELALGGRVLSLAFVPVAEQGYVNVYGFDVTDREQANEALRRGEERRALAESVANAGSWDWNIQTGDLHWSDQIEAMFGFDRRKFKATYKAFLRCVHPQDRQDVIDAVNASVQEGADYAIEHRIVWPDGTVRWMEETGNVIYDDKGSPHHMLGVVQDITRRKQIEEQIRQQNDFLSSVLESVTHPLYVVDVADYSVQMANSAAYAGRLPEDARCYRLFHGRSAPCAESGHTCPVKEITRDKNPITVEHVHHSVDGIARTMEIRGYPLLDDEGEVTAVIEYCLDVTERKQMERALRTAKRAAEEARREEARRRREAERRRRIAESLADVLAALNSNQPLDQVLDYIAEQATQLLNTQAAIICRGHPNSETFSVEATHYLACGPAGSAEFPMEVDALAPGIEPLAQAMARRQAVVVPDVTKMTRTPRHPLPNTPDADVFQTLLAMPITIQDEMYGGMVLYYTDPRSFSTEEKELAAAFGDQIALAVENSRLREQVRQAAISAERSRLARELHDSVTQALFSASLVAETLPRLWQRKPEEAMKGLEELRNLTQGALAEMRTLLLELRPTALLEASLDDLLQQLTEATTSRTQLPVKVNVDPSPSLPPDVQVTFYRIAQEALNNVIKHAEASQLTVSLQILPPVSCQQGDDWQGKVVLRVSDDGQGFAPDQTQGDHLGLDIMRERARAAGAQLTIESQPDQGTKVLLAWESSPS
ncbi:MAG: PAS domain-containing protein [Chloroflexota bacterium]